MIEDLKWTSLQVWRKTAQLAMRYRIHNNIIATDGIKNKLQPPPPHPTHINDKDTTSSSRSNTAEPSTSSTHSCQEPSETGMTCPRKSLRPRPSTHLCQGPPDCSNPKQYLVIFSFLFFFSHCWPSVKWQNNQHDDCSRFTERSRNKGPVYKPGCIHWY